VTYKFISYRNITGLTFMNRFDRSSYLSLALVLTAAASPLSAGAMQSLFVPVAPLPSFVSSVLVIDQADDAYAAGTRALDQQHWADAVTSFDQVVNAKSKRADAALYWKAYSLNKLGNGPLALATCYQLRSQYNESRWNKDCGAISISLNSEMRVKVRADSNDSNDRQGDDDHSRIRGSDEDLKILALNSLLNQDPSKAIPILRGVLSGNQPKELKRRALFVLAQSKSPEAQSILHDAVMGKMDPDLQRQAIQSLAIYQGKKANDTLVEVYRSSTDPKLKRSIISSLFITQDAPRMVDLARNEKDMELKRSLVSQLAIMHDKAATDYMMELLK
jgi:hypothetical protein